MKVLITGINGFLGRFLRLHAPKDINLIGHSREGIPDVHSFQNIIADFTSRDFINAFSSVHPEIIIHNAAMASVDQCENEQETAFQVNIEASRQLLAYAAENGSRFIYISTDQVFGGEKGNYSETDTTGPVNYYGQTKLQAERLVQKMIKNSVIIRPALFYGKALGGRPSFTEIMIRNLRAGETMPVFSDQYRSPLLVTDLAQFIWKASLSERTGIYHAGGPDRLSRLEMGKKLCRILSLDAKQLKPILSFQSNLPASRGLDCSLQSQKIRKDFSFLFTSFEVGVEKTFL